MNPIQLIHRVKNNKTIVNGGLFSLYSFMGRGISFLLLMLLANYIPPSEYGSLSLFNTVVSLLAIFMALNTEGYFSISYFKNTEENFKKNFTAIFVLGLGSMAFFLIVLLFGGDYISNALELSPSLLLVAIIISFLSFSIQIQQNYFRVQEKVVTYGIFNVGNALLNFVLSMFCVITLGQGWIGRVNAQLICTIAFGLISIYTFTHFKLFKKCWEKERYKEIIAWGLPMIPHHATGWIRQGLDRYIINFHYATYQVGIFSFALNVANIIEMIGMAFNSTNSVTLFQTLSDKKLTNLQKKDQLVRQTRLIGAIYLLASVVTIFAMSLITFYLLPEYRSSIPYIWILCVAGFLKCIYFLYCNYLFYYSKTKNLMYITFGTSIFHLLLSLAFTRFSLYFTSFIYILVQGIITLLVYKQAKKILVINLSKDK